MAEGGYDPDDTNPFDPHGGDDGDDERIQLLPFSKEKTPVVRTSTSTPKSSSSHHYNPSFVDETPSGEFKTRVGSQDRGVAIIKEVFPNAILKISSQRLKTG